MIGLFYQGGKGKEKGKGFIGIDGRIVQYFNPPTRASWTVCLVLFLIGVAIGFLPIVLESFSIIIDQVLPAQIGGACFGAGLLWMLFATRAKGV